LGDNVKSIKKKGLLVRPKQKRIHKQFDPELWEVCDANVRSKACKARKENVFLFSDLYGAIEHTTYNAGLVDFDEPAIIIADLEDRVVKLDPENNRGNYRESVEKVIKKYPEDSLMVTTKGNIPNKNIKCIGRLRKSFKNTFTKEIDPDDEPLDLDKDAKNYYFESYYEHIEALEYERDIKEVIDEINEDLEYDDITKENNTIE
jgi:hypothetical protein